MEIPEEEGRQQELREIDRRYGYAYPVVVGVVFIAVGIVIGYSLFADKAGFSANLLTEVMSIVITISVLDTLASRRARELLKQQLIREMGASDNGIALRAVNELRAHGWLMDGSLRGVGFVHANLEGAFVLFGANLENTAFMQSNLKKTRLDFANLQSAYLDDTLLDKAHFRRANLNRASIKFASMQEVDLWAANLCEAELWETDLRKALMCVADLRRTSLIRVNLEKADLGGADLRGAILSGANLENAKFALHDPVMMPTKFDENTILPDGTNWTSDTNMARFTDPKHTDFWRSDIPNSPAFRGKKGAGVT